MGNYCCPSMSNDDKEVLPFNGGYSDALSQIRYGIDKKEQDKYNQYVVTMTKKVKKDINKKTRVYKQMKQAIKRDECYICVSDYFWSSPLADLNQFEQKMVLEKVRKLLYQLVKDIYGSKFTLEVGESDDLRESVQFWHLFIYW